MKFKTPDTSSNLVNENQEYFPTEIDLYFRRHSIKSRHDETGADYSVGITDKGKQLARENSFKNVNMRNTLIVGSPRIRTQETGAFMVLGDMDDITGNETLDELKKILNKDIKIGSRIAVDNRLNFNDDPNSPVGKFLSEETSAGRFLKALVEDSDRITEETGDTSKSNYSFKAAEIARIIRKYISMSPRWNSLVSNKENNYEPTLDRYLNTHQGMQESFLAKLIEKTKGIKYRNQFVEILDNKGFGYLEGMDVKILTKAKGEVSIEVSYENKAKGFSFKQTVPRLLIEEIIKEDK